MIASSTAPQGLARMVQQCVELGSACLRVARAARRRSGLENTGSKWVHNYFVGFGPKAPSGVMGSGSILCNNMDPEPKPRAEGVAVGPRPAKARR